MSFPRNPTIFVALTLAGRPTVAQPRPAPSLISDVTIVDVEHGRLVPDQTVLIRNGRIVSISGREPAGLPPGLVRVDGRGKFLMPGLWDMHVHTSVPGGEILLGLYPALGITGVRDMNDSFPQVRDWRRRIATGELAGPRIVAAGPYLVGGNPPIPHFEIKTPEEGRAGVDSLRAMGVDFVKVHNEIPREAYFAIAERVRQLQWTFAGHVPRSVSAIEASDAGQRSLEHLTGLPNPCTPDDSAAMKPSGLVTFLLGPCSSASLEPVITRLRANHTAITPTLTVFGAVAGEASPVDSFSRYRPKALAELQAMMLRLPSMTPEALDAARRLVIKRHQLTAALYRAGVDLLVGSDAPTTGTFPGVSLHEELSSWIRAGIPPAAALASASIKAARFLGIADSLGSVTTGKKADLVLVDADPLSDVRNARRISAVWLDGRMFGPAERAALFARAAEQAR